MDEYTSMVRRWELLCPGLPEELGRVRRWVRDILDGTPVVDDVALIATELGANAITHTHSPDFRVTIRQAGSRVTISVTDQGDAESQPRVTQPGSDETHGRGLAIVAILASDITVIRNSRGHTVTAQIGHRTSVSALPPC